VFVIYQQPQIILRDKVTVVFFSSLYYY